MMSFGKYFSLLFIIFFITSCTCLSYFILVVFMCLGCFQLSLEIIVLIQKDLKTVSIPSLISNALDRGLIETRKRCHFCLLFCCLFFFCCFNDMQYSSSQCFTIEKGRIFDTSAAFMYKLTVYSLTGGVPQS